MQQAKLKIKKQKKGKKKGEKSSKSTASDSGAMFKIDTNSMIQME